MSAGTSAAQEKEVPRPDSIVDSDEDGMFCHILVLLHHAKSHLKSFQMMANRM